MYVNFLLIGNDEHRGNEPPDLAEENQRAINNEGNNFDTNNQVRIDIDRQLVELLSNKKD